MLEVVTIPFLTVLGLLAAGLIGTGAGIGGAFVLLRHTALSEPAKPSAATHEAGRDGDLPDLQDVSDVTRRLLKLACGQAGAGFAALYLPRQGEDCLAVTAIEGRPGDWAHEVIGDRHPLLRRMTADGESVELTESADEFSLPARTVLFPVLSRHHLLGLVAVGPSADGRAISPRRRVLLSSGVAAAAAAIEHAQLYQSLRQAFTEVENAQRTLLALQRVSVAAQSTLRLEQVLAQIAQGVVEGLSFNLAIVYLLDASTGLITMPVISAYAEQPALAAVSSRPADDNPTLRALLANQVLVTHDSSESLLPCLFDSGILTPDDVRPNSTIANLPLAAKGRVIGGMALTTVRPALSDAEIESLRSFAAEAAATIENARLYEELMTADRDLLAAQEQLIQTERLRTLGQLASGVAHDFNNILAAILIRVQLAQQQSPSPALHDSLKIIEQAALDGANAARRIQRLGRPTEQQTPETVDLSELVRQALELTQPMWLNAARARGVSIAAETELAEGALVDAQAGELREVLTNLILNATAAMPAGGTLSLGTERRDGEAWCTIADTGTGMTDEVKQHVFEPFFTTKGEAGSGLGMSIVATILARHHGKVEIETEPGRGTRVRFGLPLAKVDGVAADEPPRRGRARLRILIAGEDDAGRETLSLLLTHLGHQVQAAGSAEAAVRLLVEQEFDAIVTDLELGKHSGWELAESAKLIRPSAAVVLATAWAKEWDPSELWRRGVDSVLPKPYTVDGLLSSLEQALVKGG